MIDCHWKRLPPKRKKNFFFFLSQIIILFIKTLQNKKKKNGNFQSCFSYMSFNAPKSKVLNNTDWNSWYGMNRYRVGTKESFSMLESLSMCIVPKGFLWIWWDLNTGIYHWTRWLLQCVCCLVPHPGKKEFTQTGEGWRQIALSARA